MKSEQNTNLSMKGTKLFILIFNVIMLSGCSFLFDGRVESTINDDSQYFIINSVNILDKIDQGNTDVFNQVDELPTPNPFTLSKDIGWGQADYFHIAQALFQQIWQESYTEQNIYAMNFSMDCADINKGLFSEAELMSYMLDKSDKKETRIEYHLHISPSKSSIFLTKTAYTPNVNKKEPINLKQVRIPAERAVQIAETNGGAEARSKYRNECIINVITTGWDDKGWDVYYQIRENDSWWKVFEIRIDPQTGAFKFMRSTP